MTPRSIRWLKNTTAFGAVLTLVACSRTPKELGELVWGDAHILVEDSIAWLSHDGDSDEGEVSTVSPLVREYEHCQSKIEEVKTQPALPGAPRLEEKRALILARSKAEPVLFTDVPQYGGDVTTGIADRRRAILNSAHPAEVLKQTIATFRDHPERLRQVLLRDGYLYTDDPRAARLLSSEISLERLFREPEILLQRGSEVHSLKRGDDGVYVYDSITQYGERARLLLFDRVWLPAQTLGPALHLDVREFAQRLGIEGMSEIKMTSENVIAKVKFGNTWVPSLMKRDGEHLELECFAVPPTDAARVGRARDEAYRRAKVTRAMRGVIAEQVRAGLPFDEPRTEVGQQDGKLRARFEQAYFSGQASYTFNGDRYQVYNEKGDALVPQVCIDFVTETLERASGMHFAPRSEKPKLHKGTLDFDEMLKGFRRQELALRTYAREHQGQFQLLDFPQSKWVRYEKIEEFFSFLEKEKDQMRAGDIVIIRGRAAWDHYREEHTHTFFVYETDPITGMPTLLAGNSGKPRLVTWDDEMLRAPKRSVRHRIRPNMEWLYDHVAMKTPSSEQRWAAPLSLSAH